MTPRLLGVRPATGAEWDEAARNCPHATFFHTRAWAKMWDAFGRLESGAIRCDFSDGQHLVLPFSSRQRFRGLVQELVMSAAGTYGGALYGSGVTLEHLLAAVLRLARRYSLTWRLTPYEPFAALLADALYALTKNWLGLWTLREDSSETLDLKDLRRDGGLLKHVCYSCRKQIHKGERAGIAVRQAVAATEWTAFIGLYRRAISRWGEKATLSYPDELFWALQDLAPESCRLWLAYHDEKLVGGSVNFYHNHHAVEWLAAYDPDAFVLGVRNWQTMQMIEHASATGFMVYDFNPSGSLQGTRRFKQTFATQQRQAPLVVRRTVLHRVLERIRH